MSVRPVSFKSILVFNISDLNEKNKEETLGKPKHSTPLLVKAAFENNKQLKKYNLQDTFQHKEEIDGTVHNATKNFSIDLDKKYRPMMLKKDKKVFFTEADFSVKPEITKKRYFITASTDEEEAEILNELNKGVVLYAAKCI